MDPADAELIFNAAAGRKPGETTTTYVSRREKSGKARKVKRPTPPRIRR